MRRCDYDVLEFDDFSCAVVYRLATPAHQRVAMRDTQSNTGTKGDTSLVSRAARGHRFTSAAASRPAVRGASCPSPPPWRGGTCRLCRGASQPTSHFRETTTARFRSVNQDAEPRRIPRSFPHVGELARMVA